jgi:hypothetical protein
LTTRRLAASDDDAGRPQIAEDRLRPRQAAEGGDRGREPPRAEALPILFALPDVDDSEALVLGPETSRIRRSGVIPSSAGWRIRPWSVPLRDGRRDPFERHASTCVCLPNQLFGGGFEHAQKGFIDWNDRRAHVPDRLALALHHEGYGADARSGALQLLGLQTGLVVLPR